MILVVSHSFDFHMLKHPLPISSFSFACCCRCVKLTFGLDMDIIFRREYDCVFLLVHTQTPKNESTVDRK